MYGWGGEQGDVRLLKIWLHDQMSVQVFVKMEKVRSQRTRTPYESGSKESGGGAPADTA
jgi:hypothetical protein